jgi:4-carboxymuconolactone decarboxylase
MTQDGRPSGASIRQHVFGGANVQRTAPSDPLLAPFFETAIEHVWGGVWNRPGLELKDRSLGVAAVLAAIGQNEELKTHLRGALNLGWTVDELREALLQISGYAGFPAAHEAFRVLSETVIQLRSRSISTRVRAQSTTARCRDTSRGCPEPVLIGRPSPPRSGPLPG